MRPNECWTILHVSILAVVLLPLNADSENSSCEFLINVQRGTIYNPDLGKSLAIECPFEFCKDSPPSISWYKLEKEAIPIDPKNHSNIKVETTVSKDTESRAKGVSKLIFQSIRTNDSGEYQCRGPGTVGHNINISINDRGENTNITPKTVTNGTSLDPKHSGDLWMYMYTAAGIVAFVIIVIIISVTSMQGCKGKTKKETQTENQYMVIPMDDHPVHHPSLQASPRGSPSAPPSRRSTRRKQLPSQPRELPRENEHPYSEMTEGQVRERRTMEEEGSSLVYAALNHQPLTGAAAQPRGPKEECSEYAAIRVKDY